jgi:phospholipid/cholesterol/gamma-HCH transport system substrate-binding protein
MKYRRQTVLGAFLLICLATLTALTWRLAGISLRPRTEWTAYFGRNSLVERGFEIYSSGVKVGKVRSVEHVADEDLSEGHYVKAIVAIDQEVTLWADAQLRIVSRGLLGGLRAELYRGEPGTMVLDPVTPLPGIMEGGLTDQLSSLVRDNQKDIREGIEHLREVARKLDEGEGSLGRLLSKDAAAEKLEEAATKIGETADSIKAMVDKNSPKFEKFLADLEAITEKVNSGDGLVARLVNDKAFAERTDKMVLEFGDAAAEIKALVRDNRDSIEAAILRLNEVGEKITAGKGLVAKLLDDDELLRKVEKTVSNLEVSSEKLRSLGERIDRGEGTLGKLLMDDTVYNELELMLQSFRESSDVARENAPIASLTSFTALFFNVLN